MVRAELLSRDKMEAYKRLPQDLTHYSWGSAVRKIVRETQRGPFLDSESFLVVLSLRVLLGHRRV